ncbi:hypothetical protein SPRG_00278 [Saprolegnia parasitica CBS 223.65]|uniref:Phosphatidic acid phosphatase type 2/haloperoxidase domain-containing protein n=1 Tax=Saprolegnia parasitica (strain CBS 223.65) TaxID=695850 RepID=A0A067D1P5_SAPPC|nr:hypothetical protein SPRG_00278 [Saprolegnia parasitica CBS 223.65]KDO35430.1 hypothetical protein SPRG_00278 [Saprolegnia parasitica CBS 223.65]|eukprot:XP_012193770.1 hypothetical protein SPRG_00278 [Saprolegnia parasitica CBS 223.65]
MGDVVVAERSLWIEVQWVSPLMTFVFWVAAVTWGLLTSPSYRYLDTYNPTISEATSHPHQHSTISYVMACVASAIFWLVVVLAVEFGLHRTGANRREFYVRLVNLSLGCLEAVLLTIAAANLIKFNVGALRPNFAAVCAPVLSADNKTYTCTTPRSTYEASMISFPSGHTATTAATALYTTIYLLWTLYCRDPPANATPRAMAWCRQALFFPALLPLGLAMAVAVSRVTDWQHHTIDITMGTLLGYLAACLSAFRVLAMGRAAECAQTFTTLR